MRRVISALIILGVAACAPIHWHLESGADGAEERAQFNRDNAVCRMIARDGAGSAWAVGSPALVGAWMLGSAVGGGIRGRETYKDCMTQMGYIEG